tara:strand:- start:591 stop:836 length:246 start_codon:yes stop_codon:yes gene_type:complete
MRQDSKGTYTLKDDHYDLSIDYSYYFSTGSYEQPPEEHMEIESVDLNGMDITEFFWDFVYEQTREDRIYEQVIEYARENNR